MKDDEKRERTRSVNPAARRDEPREMRPASRTAGAGERPVKATQGAELNPRDQGGIAE